MARKSSTKSGDLFIGESGQLRLADKSAEQQTMENRAVECLGMTFANDDERRKHFTEKLREKLADPAFRKLEGFPVGSDEDIIALSDPPYYTACPNPWLAAFVKRYGSSYDPAVPYHREPFAADVSEGKNHPIYNAHSYHTKVPHRAIMRYILAFTKPGDVIVDAFAGTGMTGVAARLCGDRSEVQELGYRVEDDGTILDEAGEPFSKLGARYSVLTDLSPAASFIAQNYNLPIDDALYQKAGQKLLDALNKKCGWMYKTRHPATNAECSITYTIWSDVFGCPDCGGEIVFWECAVDEDAEVVRDSIKCPSCGSDGLTKDRLTRLTDLRFDSLRGKPHAVAKRRPVLIEYMHNGKRLTKKPDAHDLELLTRIDAAVPDTFYPDISIERDIDLWYERDYRSLGVNNVYDFFSCRALLALAAFRHLVTQLDDARMRTAFGWVLTSVVEGSSLMNRERPGGMPSKLSGTLYIGALIREIDPIAFIGRKIKKILAILPRKDHLSILSTGSSAVPSAIPPCTVDYVFVDPPFGSNIIYSDLSILWEGWLGISTNTDQEAVVHRRKKEGAKKLSDYQALMTASFKDLYRVLKPGRWVTVEFSNTKAAVWNSIQVAIQQAGFVVANVAALDKKQGSFKAVTTPTAVKQDLVISAYKPNGGLEERFAVRGRTEDGIWDFIATHLKNLPVVKVKGGQLEFIAERDPRILYDRMVAFYVGHSTPVPLGSADFQAALAARFPERDGMYFLPEQVGAFDKKRAQTANVGQLSIFVDDERSAISWLHTYLKARPSIYKDIQPQFMQQLGASWKKWEVQPELSQLLDQNFLCYDGSGEVPSQIHGYLSSQFKELRNLSKTDKQLREKAADRWYVPDPNKAGDLEKLREKTLLKEFEDYRSSAQRRLKVFRIDAVRAGFKHAYDSQDYKTIVSFAARLPDTVLQEDEKLLMYYDVASMLLGEE